MLPMDIEEATGIIWNEIKWRTDEAKNSHEIMNVYNAYLAALSLSLANYKGINENDLEDMVKIFSNQVRKLRAFFLQTENESPKEQPLIFKFSE